jgi:hypothetical protein
MTKSSEIARPQDRLLGQPGVARSSRAGGARSAGLSRTARPAGARRWRRPARSRRRARSAGPSATPSADRRATRGPTATSRRAPPTRGRVPRRRARPARLARRDSGAPAPSRDRSRAMRTRARWRGLPDGSRSRTKPYAHTSFAPLAGSATSSLGVPCDRGGRQHPVRPGDRDALEADQRAGRADAPSVRQRGLSRAVLQWLLEAGIETAASSETSAVVQGPNRREGRYSRAREIHEAVVDPDSDRSRGHRRASMERRGPERVKVAGLKFLSAEILYMPYRGRRA